MAGIYNLAVSTAIRCADDYFRDGDRAGGNRVLQHAIKALECYNDVVEVRVCGLLRSSHKPDSARELAFKAECDERRRLCGQLHLRMQ